MTLFGCIDYFNVADVYRYRENTKQLKSERKQNLNNLRILGSKEILAKYQNRKGTQSLCLLQK